MYFSMRNKILNELFPSQRLLVINRNKIKSCEMINGVSSEFMPIKHGSRLFLKDETGNVVAYGKVVKNELSWEVR